MSKRDIEMFLFDVYIAILKIKYTTKDFIDAQELLYSYTHWDSVIREFEIIGEASKHLIESNILEKNYRVVVDFRNQITHEYFGIDPDIVWLIIHNELDILENTIVQLIKTMEPNLKEELTKNFIEDNHYLDFVVKKLSKFLEQ